VDENNPNILCGCESHLDSQYYTAEIFPSTYTVFRKDRVEGGGGVFMCIRESLNNLNSMLMLKLYIWAKNNSS